MGEPRKLVEIARSLEDAGLNPCRRTPRRFIRQRVQVACVETTSVLRIVTFFDLCAYHEFSHVTHATYSTSLQRCESCVKEESRLYFSFHFCFTSRPYCDVKTI